MLPPSKAPITVGINALHDVPDEIDKTKYESALRTYAQNLLESGTRVVLLPFQTAQNPHNDAVYMQRVFGDLIKQYDGCELLEELSIDKAISCMRQLDVYIGMRFHGLLLATAARTPYLAITYDTKCTRFIESIHYPHAIPLGAVTADTLDQAYKEVTLNRHQALGILHVAADALFSRGKTCIEHIAL
jgi:polysaccharide pyruvyl transferase WcaK-like protein